MRSIYSLIVLFMVLILTGCTTVPTDQVFPGHMHESYLKEICKEHDIVWNWDQVSQVITLRKNGVTGTALIDSPMILIEDEQIVLNEPVQLQRGAIVVSDDFRSKVIGRFQYQEDPIIEAVRTTPPRVTRRPKKPTGYYQLKKIKAVIIDAGHGGKDPGAIGHSGSHEKEVVLDISKRLKKILENKGIKVHMTRDTDHFITLQDRSVMASNTKADAFLSIHANSSLKRSVHGVEVFSLRQLTVSELNDEKRSHNRRMLLNNLSAKSTDRNVAVIVDQMLSDNKHRESLRLAERMSRDLSKALRTKDRGTKKAGFYVLRNTFIPAVLIEVGFLSNPKEERLLKSKKYRDKVAHSIARSLLDYAGE